MIININQIYLLTKKIRKTIQQVTTGRRSLPVDSDLKTKSNKSLLVVKKNTIGRRPSRDEIQIFTTNSEKVTTNSQPTSG